MSKVVIIAIVVFALLVGGWLAWKWYQANQFMLGLAGASQSEHDTKSQKLRGKSFENKPRTVRSGVRWPRIPVVGAPRPNNVQSKKARV